MSVSPGRVSAITKGTAGGIRTSEVPFRLRHRPPLDGLRGLAILLVVLHHTTAFLWPASFGHALSGGFLGVDLFFVLSGFLITSLLLDRRDGGERGLWRFYRRRVLRLLPALALLLVTVAIFTVFTAPDKAHETVLTCITTLFYISNWIPTLFPSLGSPYLGHTWSLAIEEQFYIVWPVLLFGLLWLLPKRRQILVCVLVIIVAIGLRRMQLWHEHPIWLWVYFRTDARADELLVGAALALVSPFNWLRRHSARWVAWPATAGLMVLLVAADVVHREDAWLYLGGMTTLALLMAFVIAAAVDGRWMGCRWLSWHPLVGLGTVSYGLYLWHFPVFYAVSVYGPANVPVRLVLGYGVTAAAVTISYRFVERPALAWKRRLDERPSAGGKQPPLLAARMAESEI